MITNVPNNQSMLRLDSDELHVGAEVYPLSDVLYADVADFNGQQTDHLWRREDSLFLYAGAIVAIVCFVIAGTAFGLLKGSAWVFGMFLWFVFRSIIGQIKKVALERYNSPVTLRVHTRRESVEALQTENLIHAQFLAWRINRAVKRDWIG